MRAIQYRSGQSKKPKPVIFRELSNVITLVFRKFPKHFNFEKVSVKAYKVCGNVISNILCAIQIRAIKETKACHFPRAFYCEHIVFLKLPTHFNFEKASSKAYEVSEMTFKHFVCNTDQGNQKNLSLSFPESELYVITLAFWNYQSISVSKRFLVKHMKFGEMSF